MNRRLADPMMLADPMIIDNYGRTINYLRLAVTDRCNLRCSYCMPLEGLNWLSRKELMSYEEMLRLCSLMVQMGVEKIRITGGEPFVRKDLISFLKALSGLKGLNELSLTTNGLLTSPFIPELKAMGMHSVNLSLDTLNRDRFRQLTHRDALDKTLDSLEELLAHKMIVKINAVVMEKHNIQDIIPLVKLTESQPLSVRFIEEMPFNGGQHQVLPNWHAQRIREHIQAHFPTMVKLPDPPHATAARYKIPGFKGDIGIIAAYTRSFCGSCNRLRMTPTGLLKTCLYQHGGVNLRDAMREGKSDKELQKIIVQAVSKKAFDGWEAEKSLQEPGQTPQGLESMARIGG